MGTVPSPFIALGFARTRCVRLLPDLERTLVLRLLYSSNLWCMHRLTTKYWPRRQVRTPILVPAGTPRCRHSVQGAWCIAEHH